jgi:hypothetical protein
MKIVYHTWLCKTDDYLLGMTSRADFTYMFSIFFVDELALGSTYLCNFSFSNFPKLTFTIYLTNVCRYQCLVK